MALDIVQQIDVLKKYKKEFILSPLQWRNFNITGLTWHKVRFCEENRLTIPEVRGVYCFMIEHRNDSFPPHGYMAYVGLVGQGNSRTLRIRYADYLRDQNRPKRIHIYELLTRWKNCIYFYYAPVPDRRKSLAKIETALLDAIVPPFNKKDFTGTFGGVVRGAWQ